jgi:hypothetical protein
MKDSPSLACRSAKASAAGTTELPGWALVTGSKSSVSSECAHMALARAALTADVLKLDPTTEHSAVPPRCWTYFDAVSPGRIRDPETIAAKVSRMWLRVSIRTSSGSA